MLIVQFWTLEFKLSQSIPPQQTLITVTNGGEDVPVDSGRSETEPNN